MKKIAFALGMACAASAVSAQDSQAGSSSASSSDEITIAEALQRAEKAREEAAQAVKRADEAYADLLSLKAQIDARADSYSSQTETPSPASAGFCDNSTEVLDGKLNSWVAQCLKLRSPSQFRATDVAFQTSISKGDEAFEAALEHTFRFAPEFHPYDDDGIKTRASYIKVRVGGFATVGRNGDALFYDFDEVQSGSGFLLGAEYGLFAGISKKDARENFEKGISKARQACVRDVVTKQKAGSPFAKVDQDAAQLNCSGRALWNWVETNKNGNEFWTDTAGSLYGLSQSIPRFVIGGQFKQGYKTLSYLNPIGLDGTDDLDFSAFSDAAATLKTKPYSAKLYVGGALKEIKDYSPYDIDYIKNAGVGAVASLGYKHDFEFPDSKSNVDQTLCLPQGLVQRCGKFNLVAPEEINEWTVGGTLNLLGPRARFLPPIGLSLNYTYGFETDRHGFQVPIYFLLSDEKLKGGLKYFYRSEGMTPSGRTLSKEEGVAIILGTEFSLLGGR